MKTAHISQNYLAKKHIYGELSIRRSILPNSSESVMDFHFGESVIKFYFSESVVEFHFSKSVVFHFSESVVKFYLYELVVGLKIWFEDISGLG